MLLHSTSVAVMAIFAACALTHTLLLSTLLLIISHDASHELEPWPRARAGYSQVPEPDTSRLAGLYSRYDMALLSLLLLHSGYVMLHSGVVALPLHVRRNTVFLLLMLTMLMHEALLHK